MSPQMFRFTNIFNNLSCMFMFNFVLGSLLVSIFQYSAWLFFICVFQTDFCTIFTSFVVRATQPRVPHSVYCTLVPCEITFISTFLSTLCTTCKVSLTFHLFKISSVFPLSAKMSLTVKTLYTPHPTLWSTTWCYLSAHQRQFQYCLIQPQHLQSRYPPWVASV